MIKEAILVVAEDQAVQELKLRLAAAARLPGNDLFDPQSSNARGHQASIANDDVSAAVSSLRSGDPLILITSRRSENSAVETLRSAPANYLRLPLARAELTHALDAIVDSGASTSCSDRILGTSQKIQEVRRYLHRVAACSSNVLITGETGTGKELAAAFIHRQSSRAGKQMITLNCAAIPDTLIESELFGFERGAFTGAHAAQDGKLKLADGGTIFLDEVGDLSSYAQAKILRAIEVGEIQRLGGRQPQRVDVRVIAATNRNLESDPNFRQDLFFRLNVARVHIPPLRDRKEDILPLADSFRHEFDGIFGLSTKAFTPRAQRLLLTHRWPGNIRELRNLVEAAFIDPGPDASGDLEVPAQFRKALDGAAAGELERILLALSQTQWNKSRAAEELKWSRMTLYRKIARYKIARSPLTNLGERQSRL
jgi:DNA-binding NtrC family response regulator